MANKIFIDAQNATVNPASDISGLQTKIASLKEDSQTALIAVDKAKRNLISYQNFLTSCSFDTKNAQNSMEITSLQNNIADSDLQSKS